MGGSEDKRLKCPYNLTELRIEKPGAIIYRALDIENRDGTPDRLHLTNNGTTWATIYRMTECLQSECAAWQNNRCVRIS